MAGRRLAADDIGSPPAASVSALLPSGVAIRPVAAIEIPAASTPRFQRLRALHPRFIRK